MKHPVTTTLLWGLSFVWIGVYFSEFVMIHLVFLVLGIHLGLAVLPHKEVNVWLAVKAMIRNKERGVVTKPKLSAQK